ncbi:MAG: GNAT family N-acetyltransferase [Pseudomonadota bacterium]
MTLTISQESPLTEEAATLLNGSEAALRVAYDINECSSYNAEQLNADTIRFFVARMHGRPVGCIALCAEDGYAEIKRLFTIPDIRGQGVAKALVAHLEQEARAAGLPCILLESGSKLDAAVALYDAQGYVRRGVFGDYHQGETTVFMEKRL